MVALMDIIYIVGIILVAFLVISLILSKLYRRSSKEISFVRTGAGGQKVIMNGGALIFPILHEIIKVNMNTLKLEVRRANEQALITRDRMRVDVTAEFYVRVKPTIEAIADAAQTLGKRTLDPEALKELVEGKFVDSLRAVAAEMAMEELHEQRVSFAQKVQAAVSEDLLKNGLELESVSLTSLDQTNRDYFNPQNAFDAEGLTKLTEEIEARRKLRNDIEQDTAVKIQQKNLEAEKLSLSLKKEEEYARLAQKREVEVRHAEEAAETIIKQAEKKRLSDEANIEAKQQVDLRQILAERQVEEERIEKERLLNEKEIQKHQSIEAAEIEKEKIVKLSDQDRQIAIAERSKAQSMAQAEAEQERAKAVKAEEQVVTVHDTEVASRTKQIELIKAAQEAEREAIGVTIQAEAEKKASQDRAESVKIVANAEAEKEKTLAEAAKIRYLVDAEGRKALNEAENLLSKEIVDMKVKLSVIENLAQIIAESVKPMEAIDNIKIIQVDGLTGSGKNAAVNGASVNNGNLADQLVNSALRYRGQAPLVDSLLKEIGLNGSDINGLTEALKNSITENGHTTSEASPDVKSK